MARFGLRCDVRRPSAMTERDSVVSSAKRLQMAGFPGPLRQPMTQPIPFCHRETPANGGFLGTDDRMTQWLPIVWRYSSNSWVTPYFHVSFCHFSRKSAVLQGKSDDTMLSHVSRLCHPCVIGRPLPGRLPLVLLDATETGVLGALYTGLW